AKIANDCLTSAGRTFLENLYPRDFRKFAEGKTVVWGKGLNALDAAMEAGRPIQFISGHFGNHEAFRNALYDRDLTIGGLYKPMSNPFFNVFYEKTLDMDGKAGSKFPIGREGITAYRKALSAGEALVLLLDVAVKEGEVFDFMGQPARTSTAASAFALKADALYIPYFSMRTVEGFSVEIAEAIPHSDPLTMTKTASKVLEDRIHQSPENWFWLHRRWKYGAKG
ncbi:MAG: lysophospholipid acyltransferase family protein, partial [Planktomarina sp.]